MIDFREYLFCRLCESNFPRLYNPDDGSANETQPIRQAEPDYDALSQVIHAVPLDKAVDLLRSFNIAGRSGLTKRNFEPFRRKLISIVSQTSPTVVKNVLVGNADFFKWLINYWKSQIPVIPKSKKVNFGKQNDQGYFDQGDSSAVSNTDVSQNDQVFGLGDRVEYFPSSGSDLTHRLAWLMQWEQISNQNLFGVIRNWLLSKDYKFKNVRFKDDTEYLIKNYLSGSFDRSEIGPQDMKKIQTGISYLNQSLLKTLSDGDLSPRVMSDLIDYLINSKIVRIRGDELEYLAEIWSNSQSDLSNKYQMTEVMAKK